MITGLDILCAIARRNALADQIQAAWPYLPFNMALQLSNPKLRQRYLIANRVACFMEERELFGVRRR